MGLGPVLTTNPWLIGLVAFIGGVGSAMWSVTVMAIRQRLVPASLLGRVSGAIRLVSFGSIALGSFLAGVLAQYWGVQAVFLITAFLTALLIIPFWLGLTAQRLESRDEGGKELN